ncbi:MAG TPA: hypothetical protein VGK84_08565 [Candidatus Tumulicola sp.]|jgi:hypothetical protein
MKRSVLFMAAAAALATSGCGLTASPADNINFVAPKGWNSSPGIAGFMQFWRSPREGEVLMLFRSPKPIKTEDVLQSANLRDAQIESRKVITLCDGQQQAQEFQSRGKIENGNESHDVGANIVMSTSNGATYFAVYVHRIEMPADAEAVAATHELCQKK